VVLLCGVELDDDNSETEAQEYVVDLIDLQSVVDFKLEHADSLLDNQPDDLSRIGTEIMPPGLDNNNQQDNSSSIDAEMDILLELECESIV